MCHHTEMKRVHAPELEDESWFPAPARDGLTSVLRESATLLGIFDAAAPLLAATIAETKADTVVDLCSGGGGPLLSLLAALERGHGQTPSAVLTDLYPNESAFQACEAANPRIRGLRTPVDATAVPDDLRGVRTLFNALHHLRPEQARALLIDAARKGQPLCSFEVVSRSPTTIIALCALPFVTLAITPFAKSPPLSRLALTYLLPVVPFAVWYDGMASCLRSYGDEDLAALLGDVESTLAAEGIRYRYRVEKSGVKWTPFTLTALIGTPIGAD